MIISYEDGLAALNLEKPPRVPRTEYSAHQHWQLVEAVTGRSVDQNSDEELKKGASREFVQEWNYDFMWSTLVGRDYMEEGRTTDMGHATYAAGGTDKRKPQKSPFGDLEEIYELDFFREYGGISISDMAGEFERHYRSNREAWPDCLNCSGVYITMFSGWIEAFGWENLLKALGKEPRRFGQLAKRWEEWIGQFFAAFAQSEVPLMMVHDDICWSSGPITDPGWYREYVFPAYERLWEPVHEAGKKILFTSDGDYTEFIDDLAQAGVDGFVMEPFTDMEYVAEKYGETHVFMGNVDTRVLLSGTRKEISKEVKRCMRIGKEHPGFFMAVGNHIPPNTPVENALYYDRVYRELAER